MVTQAYSQDTHQHNKLGILVAHELHTTDRSRFGRISARSLYCGFVELDGVVSSYYAKSLALQIVRRIPEVADVVDLIRVDPGYRNRISSTARF